MDREKPIAENLATAIESEIITGRYNKEYSESGSWDKCNLFLDDIAQKHWGIKIPRVADLPMPIKYGYGYEKDWPENPAAAVKLDYYMKERSKLQNSGTRKVSPSHARKLANTGELVIVLGYGHATIAAPNDKPWPLVYRSDISYRGDDTRMKVGIKKDSGLGFFHVDAKEYNKFNLLLEKNGYSQFDVSEHYLHDEKGEYAGRNLKYEKLHGLIKDYK